MNPEYDCFYSNPNDPRIIVMGKGFGGQMCPWPVANLGTTGGKLLAFGPSALFLLIVIISAAAS